MVLNVCLYSNSVKFVFEVSFPSFLVYLLESKDTRFSLFINPLFIRNAILIIFIYIIKKILIDKNKPDPDLTQNYILNRKFNQNQNRNPFNFSF